MSNKLVNPVTGQTVTVSDDRVALMVEAGFEPADAAQVRSDVKEETDRAIAVEEFNTAGGAVASGLMGFGETASMGLLRPSEWNEAAELTTEANPTASGVGKALGVAATLPIPTGGTAAAGAGLASRAVSRAGQALNLGGEVAARVVGGTGARAMMARGAVEGATYGGIDWMGSVISGDPASVEGLVSQVGLGTVLGGAIGGLAGRAAAKADVQRTVAEGIDTAATRFGEEQGAKHAAQVVKKAARERGPLEKMVVEAQDEYAQAGARMSAADAGLGKAYGEVGEIASKQRAAAAAEDAAQREAGDAYQQMFSTHIQPAQDEISRELARLLEIRNARASQETADYIAREAAAASKRTAKSASDEIKTAILGKGLAGEAKKEADKLRVELAKLGDAPLPPELSRRVDSILPSPHKPVGPEAGTVGPGKRAPEPPPGPEFAATSYARSAPTPEQLLDLRIGELEDAMRYIGSFPGAKPVVYDSALGMSGKGREFSAFDMADIADMQRFGGRTYSPDIQAIVDRAKNGLAGDIRTRMGIDNPNIDSLINDGILAARADYLSKARKWSPDPKAGVRGAQKEYLAAAGGLEAAHGRLSESGKLLQELDDDIARRADEVFQKQAAGAREGYLNKVVQEGEVGGKQGGWFTRLIARRFGASFGAQLAGWHFGGPTGWMVLNRIFDKGVGKTAGEAVSVTRRQIMETARLKAMLLDKSSKRLVKTGEAVSRLSPRLMREDFEATRDHIANMTVHSDALGFRAGDELRTFSPEMADMLHETVMRGLNHLAETMPKDPGTMVDWAPTELEMRAWGNRVEAVFRPMQALEKVASGAGTAEHIQSLRAVYPNLVSKVAQSLADVDPRTLSPNKRLAFSLLTGMPASAHYDPKTVSGIQARMAAQRQQQPQQQASGGGTRPAPTATGNSNATMADRVTER